MSMSLRVVVPPHPLIGHWLTLLRDQDTPTPLFATAMAELGRWLTYEALRDWLPHRRVSLQTPLAASEGSVIDPAAPLLAIPMLRSGLGLWEGARTVLPNALVAHVGYGSDAGLAAGSPAPRCYFDGLPAEIGRSTGVLVFEPLVGAATNLLAVLERLEGLGVGGRQVRVISALAAAPGLKLLGERFSELTIYSGCIDAELDSLQRIVPGLGDAEARLFGSLPARPGPPAVAGSGQPA